MTHIGLLNYIYIYIYIYVCVGYIENSIIYGRKEKTCCLPELDVVFYATVYLLFTLALV